MVECLDISPRVIGLHHLQVPLTSDPSFFLNKVVSGVFLNVPKQSQMVVHELYYLFRESEDMGHAKLSLTS